MLERELYGNTYWQWLLAALIAVVVLVVVRFGIAAIVSRWSNLANRTRTLVDDFVIDTLRATGRLFILAVGIYAGARALTLPGKVEHDLTRVVMIVVLVQAAIWTNHLLGLWLRHHSVGARGGDVRQATTLGVLAFIGRLTVWSLLILMILANLGFDITALVASLGVGGVAVALAVQNILGDLFASLSIALDKPFEIGDVIVIDDIQGTVEYVGLKSTRLRSIAGEQIVLSNADLLRSRIHNYKRMHERRVEFTIRLVYDTPFEQVRRMPDLLREVVEAQPRTRFEHAHFKSYFDWGLSFEVAYYVLDPDVQVFMNTQQAINLEIYRRFESEGIYFALPSRSLYVAQQAPAAAADPAEPA